MAVVITPAFVGKKKNEVAEKKENPKKETPKKPAKSKK